MAIIAACGPLAGKIGWPYCFNPARVSNRHAAVGAKTVTNRGRVKRWLFRPNNRSSIFGDGWRGVQERNWASKGFSSFMQCSFQTGPEFVQAVTISSCRRVRRHFQQFSDFFESVLLPELEHDDLALGHRQFRQAAHRGAFGRRFVRSPFEPAMRLELAREPPPE